MLFAEYTHLHFYQNTSIKKELVFPPASLQTSRFQLVFAKDLPCVLTVRGVGRIGWQEGGKLVSVQRQAASRLLTLTTHISHLVPNNVHGVLSIVKFHRRQILLVRYDQTALRDWVLFPEASPNSLKGHTLKNTFHSLARCTFILSDCFNMYDTI